MSSSEELKDRVRGLEDRVRALEEELDSLLTADDLRALKEAEREYRKDETIPHEELVKKENYRIRHGGLSDILNEGRAKR